MSSPQISRVDFIPKGWVETNATSFFMKSESSSLALYGEALAGFWVNCLICITGKPHKEKQRCNFEANLKGKIQSVDATIYITVERFSQLTQTLQSSKNSLNNLSASISLAEKLSENEFEVGGFTLSCHVGQQTPI